MQMLKMLQMLVKEDVGQEEGFPLTTTYLAKISDIPWERNMEQCTLERCQQLHAKLQRDLMALTLPAESRQSLEIVTHFLGALLEVYRNLGSTTDTFVEMMRKREETIMGPDKWEDVKQKVTSDMAKSMFNFKEGPKRKMLKVQYFKHPEIAHLLYDRQLATYGRIPWNNEVHLYFAKFFYAELFLGMIPNYNDLPSEFFGPGKGRLYDRKGAKRDAGLPRPKPPLVT